jgi:DNA-binding IclR family transcriptional regulator
MAKVLLKALDILALFERGRPEWAEHEVATALELPTSTAHRLLGSLRSRGYVVRVPGGGYRLGPAALALGRRAADEAVAPSLRAALERVAAETGETALVGVRDPAGGGLLILDRIESAHRLRMVLDVGHTVPLHAGAGSKALLAHLTPAEIERVAAGPRRAPDRPPSPTAARSCATSRPSAATAMRAAARRRSRAAGESPRPSSGWTAGPRRSWV